MTTKTDKTLIPRLRFPEFQNSGEWEVKMLGDILNSQSSTLSLNKLKIKDKGYAVYGAEGIIGFIDEFQHNEQYISIVKDGSGVGRLNLCQARSSILGTLSALKVRDNKYSLIYAYYLLNTLNFSTFVKGAGIPHIYYSDYKELRIGIPTLPEQQKIADCLSSLDEVIAGERQKLGLLKAHKKGLLQNLFPQEGETVPKLRFPEFKDSGEWVLIKLIDTADSKIKWSITGGTFGSNLKAEDYTKYGIRIIQLQNIGDGKFIDDYKIYTSEEKANELLSCNIYSGEIIISKMGDPVGRACIIPKHLERCIMASDGIRLVVDEKRFSKYFIYSLINSKQIREAIERNSIGSTRKRIGLDELKKIKLPIPIKLEEQQKIASCLSSLDDVIQAQQQKIELLEQHKKGLLQGLFPNVNDGDNG